MTEKQQGSKDSLIEAMYRSVQCYDFESSFAAFMGAFAIFGFLPVVPGPCGLYRWSDMNGTPLNWYFEIVNREAKDCGLVLSNLKIAEDIILSYAAVLKTARRTKMCLHPDAEFYFESETELAQFVKQRRRWINGTVAGYVYLSKHPEEIFNSQMSYWQKLAVYFLILCQIGMYGVVFVAQPSFSQCYTRC
jgi:cellulose synthase/poly-beta-1,6-N-acetylglucosamine synthase-like glycosyltransferase